MRKEVRFRLHFSPLKTVGRIVAAWRNVPEGMKAEWRSILKSMAAIAPPVVVAATLK